MSVLRRHRHAQEAERRAWGEAWSDTGLVFTRENGSAMRPDYATHLFIKLVQRASLPRIRLHDLRHTNASLAAGVPMKVVSHRLGHSSLAITSDLYMHVSPRPRPGDCRGHRFGAAQSGDDERRTSV